MQFPPSPRGNPFHPAVMQFDKIFWQRAFLAFTTALFLACAAQVSRPS